MCSTAMVMLCSGVSVVSLHKTTYARTPSPLPFCYIVARGSIWLGSYSTSKPLWSHVQLVLSFLQSQMQFQPILSLLAVEWFTHLYYIFHTHFLNSVALFILQFFNHLKGYWDVMKVLIVSSLLPSFLCSLFYCYLNIYELSIWHID